MKDRITVVEMICHQQQNSDPVASEVRFCRQLENKEQPFQRKTKIGEEWQLLIGKHCWVEEPGMIFVINHEGERFEVNPTPEELADVEARVLEIGVPGSKGNWLVPPREPFRGTSTSPKDVYIRSLHGEVQYTLIVYPK